PGAAVPSPAISFLPPVFSTPWPSSPSALATPPISFLPQTGATGPSRGLSLQKTWYGKKVLRAGMEPLRREKTYAHREQKKLNLKLRFKIQNPTYRISMKPYRASRFSPIQSHQ